MKKLSKIIAVILMSLISIALLLIAMGFRINTTNSIPVGLYRITSIKNLKNAFVLFCPDDRPAFRQALERHYISPGLCPDGYGYLMKKVVAVAGDIVAVNADGVFVNEHVVPYSKPKLKDGMNRALPQLRVSNYRLKKNEIMTMTSQSEWSFDGRYYGVVHLSQIKGMSRPLWVIKNKEKNHDK